MATSTIGRLYAHRHVWTIEAVTQTKPSPFRDGDIDGELYTDRFTRGNLRGKCRTCPAVKTFHPFSVPEGHAGENMQALLTGSRGPMIDPMLAVKPRPHASYDLVPTLF